MCDHCDMMRTETRVIGWSPDRRSFRKQKCPIHVNFLIAGTLVKFRCYRERGHRGLCRIRAT